MRYYSQNQKWQAQMNLPSQKLALSQVYDKERGLLASFIEVFLLILNGFDFKILENKIDFVW